MLPQELAQLRAPGGGGRRVLPEPVVDEPVRARQDQRRAAARQDVAEQRMGLHAFRRPELAPVVGVGVPAAGRDFPRPLARERDEQGAPALRPFEGSGFEDGLDRGQQALAADRLESRVGLQVLQLHRPLDGPGRRGVPPDAGALESRPHDIAHPRGVIGAERLMHAHPSVHAEVLEGLVGLVEGRRGLGHGSVSDDGAPRRIMAPEPELGSPDPPRYSVPAAHRKAR